MKRSTHLFLIASFASINAIAQSSNDSAAMQTDDLTASTIARLEKQTDNDVKYVCGGIGINEVASLKDAASNYDLMMTFAASTGEYLANVDVEIADSRGTPVLNANCDGPIMLVDLPKDGRYRVRAEAEGRALTRTAHVRERGNVQRLRLAWPVQVVDMGISPSAIPQSSGAGASSSRSSGGDDGSNPSGAQAR
ncbi:hypothetical protein [Noviherbaspirillum sp. ST9]|uniref:hypothetical protein n=1 Tax=Noviherbaspirillum sp. ST9 TaxID=3401606 RepID=UPI003B587B7B